MKRLFPHMACLAFSATFVALGAGCNIIAPLGYLINGPDKVKKVYSLDKSKTTVVLIDDRSNKVPRRALRVLIGETAERTLLKEGTVKDMISSQSAMAAAGSDKDGKAVSVAEVGESVKASIVIYATIDSFVITPDGTTVSPVAQMRVKVVDVAKDERLFPDDPEGFKIVAQLSTSSQTVPSSTTARYQIEDGLAKRMGTDIAQLFYSHDGGRKKEVPE